ncbi:MAG: SPOR domain-containing protein [Culturomica sp.]|jgi:cell division protein FtsN|nr:SPOR domain-containing protein [Culturomica sp.]
MKNCSILLLSLALLSLVACKEKPTPPPPPAPVEQAPPPPPPAPVVEVKKPKIQNFFLIAGCFEYKENADKLSAKLNDNGYDSKVLTYYENLYLVSYDGFPTKQEALTALEDIKKEKGKEGTWVYNSKH